MDDVAALARSVQAYPRIEELKRLPILYVLDRAGIAFEEKSPGVYVASNPFREDRNPSLDIFGEHLERWGDFAEGTSGDVIDLLRRFLVAAGGQSDTGTVKDWAARLLSEYDADGWAGPTTGSPRLVFDLEAAKTYVANVRQMDPLPPLYDFLRARRDSLRLVDEEWLAARFDLGWDGERILIPYYDRAGNLQAYKTRRPDEAVMAAGGSEYDSLLYGLWLDDGVSTVVLCEGESDVWSGTHAAPEGYSFLGLPTGAGSPTVQAPLLDGRRVILAFDGDPAGRGATLRWAEALDGSAAEVLIAYLPDDADLSQLTPNDVRLTLDSAMPVRPAPAEAPTEMPGRLGYERVNQNGAASQVSDWVFEPARCLVGDDGLAWEGTIWPLGRQTTIRAYDLSSKQAAVRWSIQNGASWVGSDRDAQLLSAAYAAQSTFLPRGRGVSYTGLHDDVMVFPETRFGQSNYVYVPGKIDIPLNSLVRIEESLSSEVPGHSLPHRLQDLHDHSVMDPILAWLAIAPLRSKLRQFPILAVTGGSGTGKTTLVREVVRHFTATGINTNLTGTTKFALLGYMGCTNAFPVWFDEYRPGARKETLAEFNQLLRDAYTGQSSIKGGMGESWASVREVPVRAPIIVSGEDSFSETSHTERMVLVHLPKDGKNPDLMRAVIEADITGFAAAYYEWIRTADVPTITPEGPTFLPDRQRYNLGVLRAGWDLLDAFLWEYGFDGMGEPDWSLIIGEAAESSDSNPIRDAILWALEDNRLRDDHIVFEQGDRVFVRADAFVAAVNRVGVVQLPGGTKAVTKYLRTHYDARLEFPRLNRLGVETKIRAWSIDREMLVSEDGRVAEGLPE